MLKHYNHLCLRGEVIASTGVKVTLFNGVNDAF